MNKSNRERRIARLTRKQSEAEAIAAIKVKAIAQGVDPDEFDREVDRMRGLIRGVKQRGGFNKENTSA